MVPAVPTISITIRGPDVEILACLIFVTLTAYDVSSMPVTISLGFRQIDCRRCGDRRVVGVACPTCGMEPDPREVDPERQHRSRVAEQALSLLDDSNVPAPSRDLSVVPEHVWDPLGEWVDDFLEALRRAVEESQERELHESIQALRQLKADYAAVPLLRPWLGTWRALLEVLRRLEKVARYYLQSIGASTPIEAQQLQRDAQSLLDVAAEPAVKTADELDHWGRVISAGSSEEAFAVMAEMAFTQSASQDLLAFDRSGVEVYRQITDRDDCPPGFGIGLHLIKLQVEGALDEARFWEIVRENYQLLTADQGALQAVIGAVGWVDDFNDALVRAFDAGIEHEAMLAAARQTRQEVRALLSLVHGLIEGPGRRLAATLLAVRRRVPYPSLRDRDAGALIQQVEQSLGHLLEGLDRTLRVAKAHEDFRVEGDRVVFPRQNAEYPSLSVPELVDRALASAESVLALTAATACAAVRAGVPVEAIEALSQVGMSPEGTAAGILAIAGWRNATVEISGSTLKARGEAEVTSRSLVHAGALIPYIPAGVTHVILVGESTGNSRTLEGPTEPMRRLAGSTDELTKFTLFIRTYVSWKLDGEPLLSRDHVRKLVAVRAGEALQHELPEAVRMLRLLRSLAQDVRDIQLEQSLSGAMSWVRSSATGLLTDRNPPEPLRQLAEWMQMRLTTPFQS